ncbi:MAG: phosphate ABC transporter ATP-binding protein PstB [Bacteroidia bacterium]|nr:phosphate ABC transporter ATP-binding protein PstB [Bacteroidia bacterium]MDW8157398.1 phosphate ABC transporter ATP-binding protein PstB [Bacteroidia bacterium]
MFKLEAIDVNVYYGDKHAIKNVSMAIPRNSVVALIGPSGCGKSTFLRLFNRMNDLIEGIRIEGKVLLDGIDIYSKDIDPVEVRKRVGMVFQKPTPFPKSIFENVAYGLRINNVKNERYIKEQVEKALHQAALWEEVHKDLKKSALALSGGQQQRLCIARALAVEPSVLLMDEPTSALDPISTAKIEQLIGQLKNNYTIVIVTHNMHQAGRVSDKTGFFNMGVLVEYENTKKIFTHPSHRETENYITGRFG